MTSQLSYDIYMLSSSYTMIDASSDFSYSFQSNNQALTSTTLSLSTSTYSPSGVSLISVSSLNSDISFNCNEASFLNLAANTTGDVSLPLSCSISGQTLITYSLLSAPSWVNLNAANRTLNINTTEVAVGTTSSFTIKSISSYSIWDKTINLKVVNCNVQNWETCSFNNPDNCKTWNDGFYANGNSSSGNIWIKNTSSTNNDSSTASIITQSVVGVVGTTAILSLWNLSTPQGIWITLNQFQLILLLLLTNSHIPIFIVDYLSGLKATTWSLNFIPFKDIPGFKKIIELIDFRMVNTNLRYFGLLSGSTIVNNFSLLWVFWIIFIFHLIFLPIYRVLKPKLFQSPKSAKALETIYQLFNFSLYLRFLLEANQFILLSWITEIKSWSTTTTSEIISLVFALIGISLWFWLIIISILHWIKNKSLNNTENYLSCKEFFNNIKNHSYWRLYSTILLSRRFIFVMLLIISSSLSSIWLILSMLVMQIIYFALITWIRPYTSTKDNILEIINESFYLLLIAFLIHYNSDERWTKSAESAYFWLIIANSICVILIIIGMYFLYITIYILLYRL